VDRAQLQSLMWTAAGVHRSREGLESALRVLDGWRASDSANPTRDERENANLLQLARILVASALQREESRGAHFRSDFPAPSEAFALQLIHAREVTVPC
jgi:L-aspartate oxidase